MSNKRSEPRNIAVAQAEHLATHAKLASLTKRASRGVRPLFRVPPNRPAEQIGSGVLFEVGDARFVLTAAHVMDEFLGNTMYLGVGGRLLPVAGRAERTQPPEGKKRADDRIDAAIIRIENAWPSDSGAEFLTLRDVNVREWMKPSPNYLILGYPASQVSVDFPSYAIRGAWNCFVSPRASPEDYLALGIAGDTHVGVDYEPKRMMSDTGIRATPNPAGMSGGGVWGLPYLADSYALPDAKLIAIFTEFRKDLHAAAGTRICYHFELIRMRWPELSALLPGHGGFSITITPSEGVEVTQPDKPP